MTQRKPWRSRNSESEAQFAAEAAYGESIFRQALGDTATSIAALEEALAVKPDYAPAVFSMGSVEYQRHRRAKGRRLFLSLLSLRWEKKDLCDIIDHAGSFLIDINEYADGLELFREGARRFPDVAEFQQGIGCCAGHEGLIDEALAACYRALQLDPNSAAYMSDLGWTLLLAERHQEAEAAMQRALAIDPSNERTQANLAYCRKKMPKEASVTATAHAPPPQSCKRRGAVPAARRKRPRRRG